MSLHFTTIALHAAADGAISDAEILELRRAGWADGRMTRAEAEAIFAAQHAMARPTREWSDFFVEAIQHFVLEANEPRGHASDEDALWLIEQVQRDGRVCSMVELELLTRVIEKADNLPEVLKGFVLETLEREVLTGTGPTRCGGELSDTHVTDAECRLIRRVIFASGGERPAAVGQSEAEMLFRIKNATLGAANAPEFKRLFVQGVGNYLMGFASGASQISRERAQELDAFAADNQPQIGRFMGQMARATPNALGVVFGRKQAGGVSPSARVEEAQQITHSEQDWLKTQIDADGQVDEYETALIAFIAEDTGGAG